MTYAVSSPGCGPESNGSRAVATVTSDASFPVVYGETYPQSTAHRDSAEGGLRYFPALVETPGSHGLYHSLDVSGENLGSFRQKCQNIILPQFSGETLSPRAPFSWARLENTSLLYSWLQGPKSKRSGAEQASLCWE